MTVFVYDHVAIYGIAGAHAKGGAELDLFLAMTVWLPALLLAAVILVARPLGYRWLLRYTGEEPAFAKETGLRMGQASEFALLIAMVAAEHGKMAVAVSNLVQLTAIVTMVGSAYVVVMKYPTPVGPSDRLLRD